MTAKNSNTTATREELIPAISQCGRLTPSRAPKRDHDKWLVREMLGGAGSLVARPKSVRERPALAAPSPALEWLGDQKSRPAGQVRPVGCDDVGGSPRNSLRPSQKPQRPVRREPLFYPADDRTRIRPRRPASPVPSTRGEEPTGAFARPPPCAHRKSRAARWLLRYGSRHRRT
jgi:hypothetical protein